MRGRGARRESPDSVQTEPPDTVHAVTQGPLMSLLDPQRAFLTPWSLLQGNLEAAISGNQALDWWERARPQV